jgi:hypothetical protein
MKGHTRLAAFLQVHGISRRDAADALGVSPSMLHYWLNGSRPSEVHRLAVERYSRGEVPANCWLTSDEQTRVNRTDPYESGEHPAVAPSRRKSSA